MNTNLSIYQKIQELHPDITSAYPNLDLNSLSPGQLERLVRGDELFEVIGLSEVPKYNSIQQNKIEQKKLKKSNARGYSLKANSQAYRTKSPNYRPNNQNNY